MNPTFALAAAHLLPGAPGVQLADLNPNKVTPGLLGFVVFAAIGGAVWLLMKSMNKQFRKVNFEEAPNPAGAGGRVPRQAEEKTSGGAAVRQADRPEADRQAPDPGA